MPKKKPSPKSSSSSPETRGGRGRDSTKSQKKGMSHTLEYKSWESMKERCLNKNHKSYPKYGGRGIKVCSRWSGKNGFKNFFEDMGKRPSSKHSIDRIDVNGNYDLENCRWSSIEEQANNRTNNTFLTCDGTTMTIAQWARKVNVSEKTLHSRISLGWKNHKEIIYGKTKVDTKCIACNGKGSSSSGSKCYPCNGTGKRKPAPSFPGEKKRKK